VKLSLRRSGIGAAALLCVALAGCHHQPKVPPLPSQTRTPNIYIPPPPQPNLPPMEAPPPAVVTDVKPTVTPHVKPKKHKKPTPKPTEPSETTEDVTPPPAAPPVSAESAASAELGALSPGGESTPRQQQVAGHISAVQHRVDGLSTPTTDEQKKQVLQVRQFLKQASDALKTGDAEGAENLTTKAGLLLDDIK
jgi:hypothetical protein